MVEKKSDQVPVDLFKWIVGSLVAAIIAIGGFAVHSVTADVETLKTKMDTNVTAINDMKTSLVGSIGTVEKAIAVTNQKLDDLIGVIKDKK